MSIRLPGYRNFRRPPFHHRLPPDLAAVVDQYLLNLLRSSDARGELDELRLRESDLLEDVEAFVRRLSGGRVRHSNFQTTLKRLRALLEGPPCRPGLADGRVRHNLGRLADRLGLGEVERELLQFAVAVNCSQLLAGLLSLECAGRLEDLTVAVGELLLRSPDALRACLSPSGTLFASGLVRPATFGGDPSPLALDERVLALAFDLEDSSEDVLERFLTREPVSALGIADFGPRRPELEVLLRVLDGWRRRPTRGLNFLLHGATGVGKTEVARVLAQAAGCDLYLAGGRDVHGTAPSVRQRLASLSLGNQLLREGRSLLLFDELEDVTDGPAGDDDSSAQRLSKLWLNRVFEGNPVPTFWTTNSLRQADPALLRRFTLAIEFPRLGQGQRRRVWTRVAGELLRADELDVLAASHDVSAGEICTAVSAATLAGNGVVDRGVLSTVLEGAQRVQGRRPLAASRAGVDYRLDAVNASRDLEQLTRQLERWRPGSGSGLTLCLHGRSGTGKSEYVHYLARRLERPLMVRNVSDLKSMWVGQTEQKISAAFEDAAQEGAVLLFDEADTFLTDRRLALHEWERSQTNEFLQQLEASRGLVAVTTNVYTQLDPALLRRFTHKVEFRAMRVEQRQVLWTSHLARFLEQPLDDAGLVAVTGALRSMGELVPGDFGVVARRLEARGEKATAAELLAELQQELDARRHDRARPIGFGGVTAYRFANTPRASAWGDEVLPAG